MLWSRSGADTRDCSLPPRRSRASPPLRHISFAFHSSWREAHKTNKVSTICFASQAIQHHTRVLIISSIGSKAHSLPRVGEAFSPEGGGLGGKALNASHSFVLTFFLPSSNTSKQIRQSKLNGGEGFICYRLYDVPHVLLSSFGANR